MKLGIIYACIQHFVYDLHVDLMICQLLTSIIINCQRFDYSAVVFFRAHLHPPRESLKEDLHVLYCAPGTVFSKHDVQHHHHVL